MEIIVKDEKAEDLAAFLGMTEERIKEILLGNESLYHEYIKDVIDKEVPNPESILFMNIINRCETFEEALYIAYTFEDLVQSILDNRIEVIDNFEKLINGL